jgi:hypothetical protein
MLTISFFQVTAVFRLSFQRKGYAGVCHEFQGAGFSRPGKPQKAQSDLNRPGLETANDREG